MDLLLLLNAGVVVGSDAISCDRELRKTVETLQAWRRSHDGIYPPGISRLDEWGNQQELIGVCPAVSTEQTHADPHHLLASSRREGGDPEGMYEYEMSSHVEWSYPGNFWLPSNSPALTRRDLKAVLLRRPFAEQIPLLRCSSHHGGPIQEHGPGRSSFRNCTAFGDVYWSGDFWEHVWLADVPYCARFINVLFGLRGPPFNSGRSPDLAQAVDLRGWSCAFGDVAWWWDYPIFDEDPNAMNAPQLAAFFQGSHGRVATINSLEWWIDGLTQLQGRISAEDVKRYEEPSFLGFVSQRTGAKVGRHVQGAHWLQGTVWRGRIGEITGWLVWNYADGRQERVPVVYGETTARFWGDVNQVATEQGFPEPVWRHHEAAEEVGRERWLRLYQQNWTNPHPDIEVTTLDFVSNTNSPAAPFLIAVNVRP